MRGSWPSWPQNSASRCRAGGQPSSEDIPDASGEDIGSAIAAQPDPDTHLDEVFDSIAGTAPTPPIVEDTSSPENEASLPDDELARAFALHTSVDGTQEANRRIDGILDDILADGVEGEDLEASASGEPRSSRPGYDEQELAFQKKLRANSDAEANEVTENPDRPTPNTFDRQVERFRERMLESDEDSEPHRRPRSHRRRSRSKSPAPAPNTSADTPITSQELLEK